MFLNYDPLATTKYWDSIRYVLEINDSIKPILFHMSGHNIPIRVERIFRNWGPVKEALDTQPDRSFVYLMIHCGIRSDSSKDTLGGVEGSPAAISLWFPANPRNFRVGASEATELGCRE